MNRFVSWILSSLGYLLYTVVVLQVLLWWLFPAEPLRAWLQDKLNSVKAPYQWEIDELQATWPLGVVVAGIRMLEKEDTDTPFVEIDTLRLVPDFRALLRMDGKIPVQYNIKALDGTVQGNMSLAKDTMRIQGEEVFEDIELGRLSGIWQKMNRSVSGRMSGSCRYDVRWPDLLQGNILLELTVSKGTVGLRQPLFNLAQLEFTEAAVSLQLEDQVVLIDKGRVDSKMFAGEYIGTLTLRDSLIMSEVQVDGFIEPRPELLGQLQDNTVVTLIKSQLQDNKLSFVVSGTLVEPGILFQGASGVIDGIIQGSDQ